MVTGRKPPVMRRTIALLVPLLVVLAGATLAAGSAAQTVGDGQPSLVSGYDNTSNYLTIAPDDVTEAGRTTIGMDAGLATGTDGRELQVAYDLEAFQTAFAAADSDGNRSAAVDDYVETLQSRASVLESRHREVVSDYGEGDVAADALLRERAAIDAEARHLQSTVTQVRTVAREEPGYSLPDSLDGRLHNVAGRFDVLQGPLAERAATLSSRPDASQDVYVEGSPDGYVFASVQGSNYVREAYVGSAVNESAPDQFVAAGESRVIAAERRAEELYPWVRNNTLSKASRGWGSTDIYRYDATFTDGQITVYLDGGSTDTFREGQRVALDSIPVSATAETRNESVRMTVNRTFPTGPMQVSLTDTDAEESVDGTVVVDDRTVGTTGEDGHLWAIEPRGQVTVRATTTDANLTVTLPP